MRFLYTFRFRNQAKSLAPTLKILLVFLCEVDANQPQQSKGCCGVSHVLGFVQKSKPRTGICASDWLFTYLRAVHQKGNCHYRTSLIGYWDKGSTVDWLTACCDNSGVSGVMTWKSPDGVFAVRVFPILKQITMLFIFRCIISLLVICLCYHAFAW